MGPKVKVLDQGLHGGAAHPADQEPAPRVGIPLGGAPGLETNGGAGLPCPVEGPERVVLGGSKDIGGAVACDAPGEGEDPG